MTFSEYIQKRRFRIAALVAIGFGLFIILFQEEVQDLITTVITGLIVVPLVLFAWGNPKRLRWVMMGAGVVWVLLMLFAEPEMGNGRRLVLTILYFPIFGAFLLGSRRRGPILLLVIGILWLRLIMAVPPKLDAFQAMMVVSYAVSSFTLILFGGLALISQFVLPVQSREERRNVFDRLLRYVLGRHGPALFVKNAKLIASRGETERPGRGVVFLDSCSAASLQRDTAAKPHTPRLTKFLFWRKPKPPGPPRPQVRVVGPGIMFTDGDEYLREANIIDLRKQSRSVSNVHALTREGIVVTATVSVTFQLSPPPETPGRHPRTAYPFNPNSAFRAVYGRAVGSEETKHWTDLPLVIAKDIYRDLVARYKLDQLFRPISEEDDLLTEFRGKFADALKAHPHLKHRGIQILNASVSSFSFPGKGEEVEGVKKQRIETWLAEMKRQELQALAGGNLQADRIKLGKRLEAQHEWGNRLIKIIQLQDTQSKRAVALRLLQALETAASEPSTRKLLTDDTIKMLSGVRDWLK